MARSAARPKHLADAASASPPRAGALCYGNPRAVLRQQQREQGRGATCGKLAAGSVLGHRPTNEIAACLGPCGQDT